MVRKCTAVLVTLIAVVFGGLHAGHAEDLIDLIHSGKIEAEFIGSDIGSLTVRLRAASAVAPAATTRVDVAAGTLFAADSASVQNMIAIAGKSVALAGARWVSLQVPAACANLSRRIPNADNRMTAQRLESGADLATAARALAAAHASGAVSQAGIWIVSDNASYRDLGTLVRSGPETLPNGVGVYHVNDRVIHDDDAARALHVLSDAGIEIAHRRVMEDRDTIAEGMHDAVLKDWLVSVKVEHLNSPPSVFRRQIQQERRDIAMIVLRRAMRKVEKGDLDGAIHDYQFELRTDVTHVLPLALAHQALGNALRAKGDLAGAVAEYRSALEIDEARAATHRQLGIVLQGLGDLAGAIQEYRRAIALQPGDVLASERLRNATALRAAP